MNTLPRTLLFAAALLAAAAAWSAPKPLASYKALTESLKAGHTVRVVAEYAKAKFKSGDDPEEDGPDATGGKTINAWEEFGRKYTRDGRAYVAFSETVLIFHPSRGAVLNYVGFRVWEDGSVMATARYIRPATYEVIWEGVYRGAIDDGRNNGAFRFFRVEK